MMQMTRDTNDKEHLAAIAKRYWEVRATYNGSSDFGATDGFGHVFDYSHRDDPEAWELAGLLADFAQDDDQLLDLGCGFLEDLIQWGPLVNDDFIERFIREHPNSLQALRSVWAWDSENRPTVDRALERHGKRSN